jgi:4-hydroxysphinganine ceramide fatty acyl 2-hydroxylase
MRFSGLE